MPTLADVNLDLWAAVLRVNPECIACGATATQVDHIRPAHAGGTFVLGNVAPLCAPDNQVKSCFWPWHGYHPLPGLDDPARAHHILLAEVAWVGEDVFDWSDDGEPSQWAFRVRADGVPRWVADQYPARY